MFIFYSGKKEQNGFRVSFNFLVLPLWNPEAGKCLFLGGEADWLLLGLDHATAAAGTCLEVPFVV